MELRWLAYFVATAELGSVSAAAANLRTAQPSLSRQLRQLERDVGADLFVRTGGRLVLSAAGREFLPIASDLLLRADIVRDAAHHIAAGRINRIEFVTPPTTLVDIVAPFLATFRPEDPVPFVREPESTADVVALTLESDLAVIPHAPPPTLSSARLARLPVLAYVPAEHRWRSRAVVDVEELVEEPLIVNVPAVRSRQIVDHAVGSAGLQVRRLIETSHGQVAQALAAAGRGVAVVGDDPRFGLHPLRIRAGGDYLWVHLHAAWRHDHHGHVALARMAERLRRFCVTQYGQTLES